MKKITKREDPEEFSRRLNQVTEDYDIPAAKLMKAAGITDESFLQPYLTGSSNQVTETQNKLYLGCAKIIASILDSEILNAGINYEYIADVLNVSRTAIDNRIHHYEEMSDPFEHFGQIKAVIDSSQYYLGFKRLSNDEFAKFFDKNDDNTLGKLWKKNGVSIEKINNDLGLTKNIASLIRNGQQHLSTQKQYDILFKAYDMCVDYTCRYYEGFEDVGKKLYHLLNLQYHEDIAGNFYEIFNMAKKLLKFDTDELYSLLKKRYSKEKLTISHVSFELLCTNKKFHWDIKEKVLILEYIFNTEEWKQAEINSLRNSSGRNQNSAESEFFSMCYSLREIQRNLKGIKDGTEEKRLENLLKDLPNDLKQYPLETQKIILSHAEVFLDIDLNKFFKNASFGSYFYNDSTYYSYDREKARRSIHSAFFYYIDHFIDLFRDLSLSSRMKLIKEYSKDAPVYLNWSNSEFIYISQCIDMILKCNEIILPDEDYTEPKPSDYLSMKKTDRKFWLHYDKEKIKARVRYTNLDWNFMTIIILMMSNHEPIDSLEQDLEFMYEIEHYNPAEVLEYDEDASYWDDIFDDGDDDDGDIGFVYDGDDDDDDGLE